MIKCFIIINNHGAHPCQRRLTASPPSTPRCAALGARAAPRCRSPAACLRAGKPRLTKFYEQLVRRAACGRQPRRN